MKRTLIFVLSLFLVLSCFLFSCTRTQVSPEGEEVKQPSPAPADPAPEQEEETETEIVFPESEEDDRYRFVELFLNRDVAGLSDFLRPEDRTLWGNGEERYEEFLAPLETLEFGEYKVEKTTDDYGRELLKFSFEIRESGWDLFGVGEYTYTVDTGMMSRIWWEQEEPEQPEVEDALCPLFYACVNFCWDETALDEVEDWEEVFILESAIEPETPYSREEIEERASRLFGRDLSLSLEFLQEADGRYVMGGHGGTNTSHTVLDVRENGAETEVLVRFFAEDTRLIPSHLVRYRFFEDGDGYSLREIKQLEKGELFPCVWAV